MLGIDFSAALKISGVSVLMLDIQGNNNFCSLFLFIEENMSKT